mmetsp:Transcript_11294/g.22228  ORF Transcript_11294/g.22228 Transcript_11294/m.22228 type:complete len:244 (-) Transcript_11294:1378-2109(-)
MKAFQADRSSELYDSLQSMPKENYSDECNISLSVEFQGHSNKTPPESVVITSASHSYKKMLEGITPCESFDVLSDFSFTEEEKKKFPQSPDALHSKKPLGVSSPNRLFDERISTIYTNLSSDSSKLVYTRNSIVSDRQTPDFETTVKKSQVRKSGKRPSMLIQSSMGMLPSHNYCPNCNCEVATDPVLKLREMNWVNKVSYFFNMFRCCGRGSLNNYYEVEHICRKCKKSLGAVDCDITHTLS